MPGCHPQETNLVFGFWTLLWTHGFKHIWWVSYCRSQSLRGLLMLLAFWPSHLAQSLPKGGGLVCVGSTLQQSNGVSLLRSGCKRRQLPSLVFTHCVALTVSLHSEASHVVSGPTERPTQWRGGASCQEPQEWSSGVHFHAQTQMNVKWTA